MLKRKPKDHTMLEGKRKKKNRTKQDAIPRPACSWVYFSREFIKEYTASHPESSGLKAATKAASDAWKSMSLEEKAKYTWQAREVWDAYLSTAPSPPPKPRKQTKLVTRCSPGRLLNVIQRLTSEQKESVKSMGFGSLLGLRCRTLRRSLCLWLLERFDTTQCCLEICGHCIPLYPKDVEHVMGLASDGKEVINSGPDELVSDLRLSYNAVNHGISVRLLEEKLLMPEAGEDFKRSFVLYALGTLLSPTARLDVSPSFLHFLTNMDAVHQYNWGKFLLDRLLFYYDCVSVDETKDSSSVAIPCLSSWGEGEITEREKREKQLGGYGFGKVICEEQCVHLPQCDDTEHSDGSPVDHSAHKGEDISSSGVDENEPNLKTFPSNGPSWAMETTSESAETSHCNNGYYCNEKIYQLPIRNNRESCAHKLCTCPVLECSFIGSSEQLSLHFSGKHWDSGRRFRYNSPLLVCLSPNEHFLVLQAEEDGKLFILNKSDETIGCGIMLTRIEPCLFKERFLYDLIVSGRGSSSLRLKSTAENFPGRVEGFPPLDFLLVPFRFLGASGEINLEVCIWSSEEHGEEGTKYQL